MNNESGFTPFLANLLDNANKVAEENGKEKAYQKAKHDCHVYIGQRRLPLSELPSRDVKATHRDYNSITIVTEDLWYIHITAEPDYGGGIDFDSDAQLDLEDAHKYGILPDSLYDAMEEAETEYDALTRDRKALAALRKAIKDLGPKEAALFIASIQTGEFKI
jgi:hypothetical protein